MKSRWRFSKEFKLELLREVEARKNKAKLRHEHEIHPAFITHWEKEYNQDPNITFKANGNAYKESARTAKLERLVDQLHAENADLKKTLASLKAKMVEEQRKK